VATIYYVAATLDGRIADVDDSLQWLFDVPQTPETEQHTRDVMAGVGALVMGARTYRWCLEHDDLLNNPQVWVDRYGDTPIWVLTHEDLPPVPGCSVRVGTGDLRSLHRDMVAAAGDKNVWVVGGGEVAAQFVDAGLLDEIHLGVAPVALGAGVDVLPRRLESDRLELLSVEKIGGFALLVFRVSPDAG
jgi:dihydrofolate reductase